MSGIRQQLEHIAAGQCRRIVRSLTELTTTIELDTPAWAGDPTWYDYPVGVDSPSPRAPD